MSYDIDLVRIKRIHKADVGNYTGNVSGMWHLALGMDLYEFNGMEAKDAIPTLERGIAHMEANPGIYNAMNPANGWGNYQGALEYLQKLLEACKKYKKSTIEISC